MESILERIPSLPAALSMSGMIRDPKSLFLLLAMIMFVMYGLSVGRTRAIVSLLAIYVSYVLTVLFPFVSWLVQKVPEQHRAYMDVGLFLALYCIVFALISSSMRKSRASLGEISILKVLVISVVQIGLLASIAVSLLPEEISETLFGPLRMVVAGDRAVWSWAAASLLILPFMRGRRRAD